jgi:hypothetical protein
MGMGIGPMSRQNKVIAYFIGIFIFVGFPAFGGGHFFERPIREHWGEHVVTGDRFLPLSNFDDFRDALFYGPRHSRLDPAYDWTPRTVSPIEIEPAKSPDEIQVQ